MPLHPIPPVRDEKSEILILGSFPSKISREKLFYYANGQNRFWSVLGILYGCEIPEGSSMRRDFLKEHNIALWDVIKSCDIDGSSDSTIKNVVPNDIGEMLKNTRIKRIFTNGATAKRYYDRYILKSTGIEAIPLPSTSSANASYSLEKLVSSWKIIL